MTAGAPRRVARFGAGLAVVVYFGAAPGSAHGDDLADPSSHLFSCLREARAFVQEHSAGEIRAERDRWLAIRAGADEPAVVTAHRWCLIAELMRSLGDDGASGYYARAFAATGDPGYELRLADYFHTIRGPRGALVEHAGHHYQAALDGVRARANNPGASDDAIAGWATRGLQLTYQQDGFAVLPWRASREARTGSWPSLAVMVGGRIGFDTNDTPVDMSSPAQVDDARRFTSEAMFAASALRTARPLRDDELQAIARASLRTELMARGRLRSRPLGAIDVWYRQAEVDGGEITNFQQPMTVNDIATSELGAGFSRRLDLSPVFDLSLAGNYRRVHRVGVVEAAPEQAQDFHMLELRPAVARFLGPDKLSLAATYAVMAIPDVTSGVLAERARGRTIASLDVDYAMNRLSLRPFEWPALRAFAGIAQDDETFGTRRVRRRDVYLGLGASGLRRWDLTGEVAVFSGEVEVRPQDLGQPAGDDPQQSNAQLRTTLVLLRRLIDEDAPGPPRDTRGFRPSSLNLVATMRHDVALRGLAAYENVRGGLELWAKVFVSSLRGTAVLLSAGYDNQYFYTIGKDLHIVHLDVRMGW